MSVRPVGRGLGRAAADGAAWGVGVAIGVAVATWVTAAWGTGAPGPASLDPGSDLLAVPVAAGLVVGVVVFAISFIVGRVSASRAAHDADGEEHGTA